MCSDFILKTGVAALADTLIVSSVVLVACPRGHGGFAAVECQCPPKSIY